LRLYLTFPFRTFNNLSSLSLLEEACQSSIELLSSSRDSGITTLL
jgi:hypothetical protein